MLVGIQGMEEACLKITVMWLSWILSV